MRTATSSARRNAFIMCPPKSRDRCTQIEPVTRKCQQGSGVIRRGVDDETPDVRKRKRPRGGIGGTLVSDRSTGNFDVGRTVRQESDGLVTSRQRHVH